MVGTVVGLLSTTIGIAKKLVQAYRDKQDMKQVLNTCVEHLYATRHFANIIVNEETFSLENVNVSLNILADKATNLKDFLDWLNRKLNDRKFRAYAHVFFKDGNDNLNKCLHVFLCTA